MSDTSTIGKSNSTPSSCFRAVKERSTYADVALVVSSVTLLVIGMLATAGVFNFIGTTNAAYLSYGMYGAAALLFIVLAIKCIRNCAKLATQRSLSEPITKMVVPHVMGDSMLYRGKCTIEFENGETVNVRMEGAEIFRMIQEVGYDKCFYKSGSKPSLQAFSSYSQYSPLN